MNGSPTRTKGIKGLIKNNNPLPFAAGNAFPLPKSRVTSSMPTGKPTVKVAFPMLEALKKSRGQGQDAKSKEAYAIEHHGVRHHLSSSVLDPAESASRFRIDSHVHTPQGHAKALQTMSSD